MKKLLYTNIVSWSLVWTMTILVMSCDDENEVSRPPVITEVRNYAPSPDDTVVTTLTTGQWVVLIGKHMEGVSQVYFGSIPAEINNTLFTDGSIVVQVPSIPFQSVPSAKVNEITVVNSKGSSTFTIGIVGDPIITHVRNGEDSPNDTIVNSVFQGQQVNIIGYNLRNATAISFQGVAADLADIVYTDTSVIVKVPDNLSGGDASLAHTISYETPIGTSHFAIRIVGPPLILFVSNENALEGDSVYLVGDSFMGIQDLTFAGVTISDYFVSDDGTLIGFVVPELTQGGPVEIVTLSGTFTTAFKVNDTATGAISNFEWDGVFNWDWWGGANLSVADASINEGWISVFPEYNGNSGKFLTLHTGVLASGAGADWTTAVRITNSDAGVPWFTSTSSLEDPASAWALKFEFNVPEDWEGASLCIKTSNPNYMVRYEPWQISPTKTEAVKTNGWTTLTIPLNAFRTNDTALGDGKGTPAATVKDLFNMASTSSVLLIYVHNYGSEDTETAFHAAFDNFRVVKR